MDFLIEPMSEQDRESIIRIYNYYIRNSFAAFPETEVSDSTFDFFMEKSLDYPTASIKTPKGRVIGFGFLGRHNSNSTFAETAEITYFICPNYTGHGLGKQLLDTFEQQAHALGIKHILACISSLNTGSRNFHHKHGFVECGCFKSIARKNGRTFDIIWMQKTL